MNDQFAILPLDDLLRILLNQFDNNQRILGISKELFFIPKRDDKFRTNRFGSLLETPIGVAAGPQTQLAQNIVTSWLTGARFIELKTVQTLDELEVSKPCIDMQDEGYNCEWSQELKISQSFDQYLNAWIIIHILKDKFGWDNEKDLGTIFNMSIGYNYEGILKKNVQWFFNKMADASAELKLKIESVKAIYPNVVNLDIKPCLSDNITLSTMHGCPADEIEKIAEYLITEKKLHTAIKLNPTLLGKEKLKDILQNSGFETDVPDIAFEHDLKYKDAINIIKNLLQKADDNQVQFSIKLTNTLESLNNKEVFSSNEKMMYLSGRALHPISINLAYKLQSEFKGKLDMSFSGGADAFNVAELVNCGLNPVTICTDLLKPGGYGRLHQYIEELRKNNVTNSSSQTLLHNLKEYTDNIASKNDYKRTSIQDQSIKTIRPLGEFDCIHAPCVDTCPTNQGIPDYLYYTSQGDFEKAAQVIKQTNPFPITTGMICDHLCQSKCTRINYDSPVLIREVKRFIAEYDHDENNAFKPENSIIGEKKVSIIGAGPSGLSCAYFLAKAGMQVDVYEAKSKSGGMITGAIPSFRLTDEATKFDTDAILKAGVKVHYNSVVNAQTFESIHKNSDFIYIGTGAIKSSKLNIPGNKSNGVLDPLDFLYKVKKGENNGIGKNVIIIGGGNTAMDAARTAHRLVGENGKVTIVYRRTIKQMPADQEEIKAVLEEGITILELTSPLKVNIRNNQVESLSCSQMKLGEKDESGRARPIKIPNSDFELDVDTIIPAIGQEIDIDFLSSSNLKTKKGSYETLEHNVFIGGDALRGASSVINAIGDGRKAAQEIIDKIGINFQTNKKFTREQQIPVQLIENKTKRILSQSLVERSLSDKNNFDMISTTLTKEAAMEEASRCLLCDEICNTCVTVCPNLAFFSYEIKPVTFKLQKAITSGKKITIIEGSTFEVKQKHQILHIADWCNQCGNCNTFCPSSGAPYLEKPHLYLVKEIFEQEKDGYFIDSIDERTVIQHYFKKQLFKLEVSNQFTFFSTSHCMIKLKNNDLRIIDIKVNKKTNSEIDLKIAAKMSIILKGANAFFKG
jgi:putative selenate reductase